jgi:hypothetical protein
MGTTRKLVTYACSAGELAYLGMWVDGIQVAAAVRQDDCYAEMNGGARWSLWSSGLTLRTEGHNPPGSARPLPVRDEADARAWLYLFADLAEQGPSVIEEERRGR